jgi:ribosomal protein S18 acetylase RimI-like enzyme
MIRAPKLPSFIDPMPSSAAPFRIRAATPADGERVAVLCAALSAEEATGSASGFTAEIFRRDGFGPQPAFACLLAEQDGQALGYALYHDDYDTDRLSRSVYLADLYVETAARGRGIGRALIAAVAQAGARRDARVMMWSVLKTNLAARRFYAGIGEEIDDQVEALAAGPQFEALVAAAGAADGIALRTAAAADCPLLARFLGNMLAEIGLEEALEAVARFSADGFGTRPAFTAVIAEHAGVPAGYALYWPTYDTEWATRGGWLSDLYMLPQARRQGVARRLMAEVAARTAAQGGRYLTWLVHTENTRARAFYRTLATEWPHGIPCICAGQRFQDLAAAGVT